MCLMPGPAGERSPKDGAIERRARRVSRGSRRALQRSRRSSHQRGARGTMARVPRQRGECARAFLSQRICERPKGIMRENTSPQDGEIDTRASEFASEFPPARRAGTGEDDTCQLCALSTAARKWRQSGRRSVDSDDPVPRVSGSRERT